MRSKDQIIQLFISKGILSNKTSFIRRPYDWRNYFDDEAQSIFGDFSMNYRTEREAWFCLCRDVEAPICPVCNVHKCKFDGKVAHGLSGFRTTCEYCSANCAPEKIRKTKETVSKHTEEDKRRIFQKRKATNKIRYNDENYSLFGSKSFYDNLEDKYGDRFFNNVPKRIQTCLERYGVQTNLLIPEVHQKAIRNSWSDECRAKRIETCMEQNGVSCLWCKDDVIQENLRIKRENISQVEQQHNCTLMAKVTQQYGQGYKCLGLEYLRIGSNVYIRNEDLKLIDMYYHSCHTNHYTSKKEKQLLDFVKNIYSGEVRENCTDIVSNENHRFFELDIFIPDKNLAIDFNGTYWHSTDFKDTEYHQRKTRCCRKAGIQMIHVFEDQWESNMNIVQHVIQDCINMTYENIKHKEGDIIVGDNNFPIYGDYEIMNISKPIQHTVGKLTYYDAGEIIYRSK